MHTAYMRTFDFEGAARVIKLSVATETDALHPAILDGMPLAFSASGQCSEPQLPRAMRGI